MPQPPDTQTDRLLDEALLAILADACSRQITLSQALVEIKQAFDYHSKKQEG